ncbi:hypothetical protein RxyAA322_22790 [Rubrobacter xylanophilus]|uniref:Uncharacterized protein n=1 Tax=Rubrobacter xylanophilus TaxID=49319 RepID=A0A510HM81_9ACTN|nr:(2,3-dihydroxybenzoyl)adenylate synthase [Rubrobacter xylanophilus]BBL80425.1 hypothetical protein RxyAA322_22790 [Rubrobacter xylanophilus]
MRGRRLVLGYDGGCGACSALAQRIEEAVGERLEVRSLHDPQVEHWREQALGKDAPWAPTLIEVSGDKARAWTGVWMGAALARRLGPTATWRVMQALGEAGTSSTGVASMEEASGISRGRFLKAMGGLAVVFPLLSLRGVASTAQAQLITTGTLAQRQRIAKIVHNSYQYKNILSDLNKPIDFASARFGILEETGMASVAARTRDSVGLAAIALFFVDLRTGRVQYCRYATMSPRNSDKTVIDSNYVEIVAYEKGQVVGKVSLVGESVVKSNGKKMSVDQYLEESAQQSSGASYRSGSEASLASTCRRGYRRCVRDRFNFCFYSVNGLCFIARYFGIAGIIACWLYPDKRSGCQAIARVSCYRDYC